MENAPREDVWEEGGLFFRIKPRIFGIYSLSSEQIRNYYIAHEIDESFGFYHWNYSPPGTYRHWGVKPQRDIKDRESIKKPPLSYGGLIATITDWDLIGSRKELKKEKIP